MSAGRLAAVLFDLDGTLIDSAPDLLYALDCILADLGLPGCDHAALRHHASRGAAGILDAGLPVDQEHDRERLKQRFLDIYADNLWRRTRPFAGVDELLEHLGTVDLDLGIVTNKISRFADPVVEHAGWAGRFKCLITGDRVRNAKPDPEPVVAACRILGVAPSDTLFIGDDRRDILAGQAAGARTAVARWGYIEPGLDSSAWGADLVLESPDSLIELFSGPFIATQKS